MIHIAICDDSKQERQILAVLFKRYQELHATPLQIHIFQNGFSLLDAIDQGKRFDITILDILMPGENGIEIARNIRASGADTEIIFLTSSPEYAVDSYEVKAQNYLLKPVTEEKFFASIDSILAELDEKDTASFIIYTTEKQYSRIRVSSLVYGEVTHRTITLHLADQTMISAVMTFTEFQDILKAYPDFIYPHRSYAVNMNYIQYVTKSDIILTDGQKIPLSRNNYMKISEQFLNFAYTNSFGK
ncbi:LytTR family DNA-binding domain-containing protein [Coprococcus eutactus]|uniref:LytR/AlgR family response regulator transcription factor n=1 Tax=Coprococcus eutactus TaxID=33043 RepID=UPI00156FC3E5|nr:LytTR family DNA-binding domain-containing protein [Coprococcus eutactus]MCB5503919.1 LytTR family DNA-binding domain-containing protein [Coprococcus eutactus]NSC95738.1 response regulator transcription factor [Coprococcus eutactus]NSD35227.1 response regulator transcription factor [Coprococcus eutactus]